MKKKKLNLTKEKISFGTDGWRGILGVEFTLERLLKVAAAAAQELAYVKEKKNNKIIIGYDRRFLAEEMAEAVASAVRGVDLVPLLASSALPTPSCSWGIVEENALGALVITASHNPCEWLGLKIKGPFGGSVDSSFTDSVQKRLDAGGISIPIEGVTEKVDFRKQHLLGISQEFDMHLIADGLRKLGVKIFVDPMHGSAAGCMSELFGVDSEELIYEIRTERDPSFGGNPPEPLKAYLSQLIQEVQDESQAGKLSMGLVFDGDGDRIAAIDEKGRYCNTQLLMPVLIDHLARVRNMPGCVVKTVSGSDLMRLVAEDLGREVLEKPVGFKYIAEEMLSREVLIGGEESGGVGFGHHLPERDALFTALLLMESIVADGKCLGEKIDSLHARFGKSHFERIDLTLKDMEMRRSLEDFLKQKTPSSIGHKSVLEVISTDGIKLILDKSHWLMFRFSGTEPLLRIYCEAPSSAEVTSTLYYAKQLIDNSFG